jgi:hypothetical protein
MNLDLYFEMQMMNVSCCQISVAVDVWNNDML